MSDISLNFTWFDLLLFALLLGSPGLALGALVGAIAWRRHRVYAAIIGAVVGFALWIAGWFAFR
jgi:Na+/proline symporter